MKNRRSCFGENLKKQKQKIDLIKLILSIMIDAFAEAP